MRIVIDMQGAQTESRFRGIGRYTLALTKAIVRNRKDHDVLLALNGLFPETIETIRTEFQDLLPQKNIRVWHAPGPVREKERGNDARRKIAEIIREAFLFSLHPDIIHICNLFEGHTDDAVTSIYSFDKRTPVTVSIHDLIPLINHKQYLKPNPRYRIYYNRKLEFLKLAAAFFAVSEHSGKEGIAYLGIPKDCIYTLPNAVEPCFSPMAIEAHDAEALLKKFKIHRPFLFYTGGMDQRKNLPRLIKAFAELDPAIHKTHQLVITGKAPDGNIARLKKIAKQAGCKSEKILFTGYVTDKELINLYNLCKAFIFPSWHEGFGLPVLEAMACGAPVICSNTSSLPEVMDFKDALFDPYDLASISSKLTRVLTDEDFRTSLAEHSLKQAVKFSWDKSAMQAIAAWEKIAGNRKNKADYATSTTQYYQFINSIAEHIPDPDEAVLCELACCISKNFHAGIERQLLIDISGLTDSDAATDLQRKNGRLLKELLDNPPADFRVEPVYAIPEKGYCYARCFTKRFLDDRQTEAWDDPVRWQRGDIFLGFDMPEHDQGKHADFFQQLQAMGVIYICNGLDNANKLNQALIHNIHKNYPRNQLFVDISELVTKDAGTGIQRVVKNILREWLSSPPAGFQVEPVYATIEKPYRYARKFSCCFLGCPSEKISDDYIDYAPGDVFFGLDLQPQVVTAQQKFFQALRRQGVMVQFLVHDLLSLQMPQFFAPGNSEGFTNWLKIVTASDGAVCVSKTTADALSNWVSKNRPGRKDKFRINWFHNGSDFINLSPRKDLLSAAANQTLNMIRQNSSFLMVGTLEPRKGHKQVLDAFSQIWQSGKKLNLVIVGKQGWMVDKLARELCSHPEFKKQLFWLQGIRDEYLNRIYSSCTCLIAASYGEGFGLPLIEAAQHKLPIMARDIPVFREIARDYAFFFNADTPGQFAQAIQKWISLYEKKKHPVSYGMPWLTWKESATRLTQALLNHRRPS